MAGGRADEPLACPTCGRPHPAGERFCEACGMPLVPAGDATEEPPRSEAHARARKIDPAYTEGDVVRVAGARNQAEAELIQGLLLEQGVPSMLRRTRGFDVPDFLAAGPRDVLVPASGARVALELLDTAGMAQPPQPQSPPDLRQALRIGTVVFAALFLAALVVWLLM